jgi:hypothetical protein
MVKVEHEALQGRDEADTRPTTGGEADEELVDRALASSDMIIIVAS